MEKRVSEYRDRLRTLPPSPTVQTPYGSVTGVMDPSLNLTQYLGVPFAAPPVGDLRWKPAQEPAHWGSLNATWWGNVCPQDPELFFWGIFSGMSEDCLSLNLYVPTGTPPSTGWPVLFWIFGGGWLMGAGGYVAYDPALFPIPSYAGVATVTINYRVGMFGWLAGDPLKSESSDGSVGNFGLQDMKQALAFVNKVAPSFNLDTGRITIFGESAGGGSVSHFLTDPRTWGLYQRAMIESGPMATWIVQNYTTASAFYPALAAAAGCPTSGAASVACLRALPWQNLTTIDMDDFYSLHVFSPVIDGVEVLDDPRVLAAQGRIAPGVGVIIGSNEDEGSMFAMIEMATNGTEADYEAALAARFGSSLAAAILPQYPASAFATPFDALTRVLGDNIMTCPTRDTAQWLTASTRQNASSTYSYLYVHRNMLMDLMMPVVGVCHAADLLEVWDVDVMLLGPGEGDLAKAWTAAWANFGAAGSPNSGYAPYPVPTWNPYGGAAVDSLAILDTGLFGVNVTNNAGTRKDACDFWAAHRSEADAAFADLERRRADAVTALAAKRFGVGA